LTEPCIEFTGGKWKKNEKKLEFLVVILVLQHRSGTKRSLIRFNNHLPAHQNNIYPV